MDEAVNREVRKIVRKHFDLIGGKLVYKSIQTRPWSQTWDSITAFEEQSKPCGDGEALEFAETCDPNKPPEPCPPEYKSGRKSWTGKDGNVWRWNMRTEKWVNVSGPVERGRNA